MRQPDEAIEIQSRDYWFKIVEFLQQNWALIDQTPEGVVVWFFGDTSGVFDQLAFASTEEAEADLLWNGFRRYADDPEAKNFIESRRRPIIAAATPMARSIRAAVTGSK